MDGEASDKPIGSAVLSRMKQFRAMNKLKKMALNVRLLLHGRFLPLFFLFSYFLLLYLID